MVSRTAENVRVYINEIIELLIHWIFSKPPQIIHFFLSKCYAFRTVLRIYTGGPLWFITSLDYNLC